MPNPFFRLKKKLYIEFAVAVGIIFFMVVMLCLFSGDNDVKGLTNQTAAVYSDSSEVIPADGNDTSGSADEQESDKDNNKNKAASEVFQGNSRENSKEHAKTTEKATVKNTKSKTVTSWSAKYNNQAGLSASGYSYIDNFKRHMISGLTADQAVVLNQILDGISNFETDISIKDNVFKKDDIESLKSLFVLVKIACIENNSVASTYQYAGNDDYLTAIKLTYTKTQEQALSETNKLKKKVDSVLKGIRTDMNEFERIEYIHDTINKMCIYGESDTGNQDSAYGCLVEGKAVCEGYSKAFLLLCNYAGIDCTIVTGTAISDSGESASHMWNMVMVDGKWYHIDLTWDDPTLNPFDKNYVRYDFFNLTDSEISQTHTGIKNEFYDYPQANSTKYNYFVYYNYCAYDFGSAYDAMERAATAAAIRGNKYVSIKLNNNKTFLSVKNQLFKELKGKSPIFTLLKKVKKKTKADFSTGEISKIFNEQTNVITIGLK